MRKERQRGHWAIWTSELMDTVAWIVAGVVLAILGLLVFLFYRSTSQWRSPSDLNTEEGRKLLWIRWSRGDRD
jgi:hypothetical protein